MMKKFIMLVMITLLGVSVIGCTSKADVSEDAYEKQQPVEEKKEETTEKEEVVTKELEAIQFPLEVETGTGPVTIEKEPMKIISMGPNITEAIYTVGAGEKLVGRTSWCNYPEQALEVAEVGSLQEPNIEKIVEIAPDLVIVSTHFPKDAYDKLNELGVQTIQLYEPDSFEGAFNIVEKIGTIANKPNETAAYVKQANERMDQVAESVAKVTETPSVYYVVAFGQGGEYTATGETFINEMIQLAGGDNIAKDATGWAYSVEKLVEMDPEYIFISSWMEEGFKSTEPYASLTAVKEEKVFVIDEDMFTRQGPRVIDALETMTTMLHGEK